MVQRFITSNAIDIDLFQHTHALEAPAEETGTRFHRATFPGPPFFSAFPPSIIHANFMIQVEMRERSPGNARELLRTLENTRGAPISST